MTDEPNRTGVPGVRWRDVAILTLGMGIAVTISWFGFGRMDSYSLDPSAMVRPTRLLVYVTQFLLVAVLMFSLARGPMRQASMRTLAISVVVAWLGQGIVLTLIGAPLVANELDPEIAWYYWLVATAGPLQPAVGFVSGWFGLRTWTRDS